MNIPTEHILQCSQSELVEGRWIWWMRMAQRSLNIFNSLTLKAAGEVVSFTPTGKCSSPSLFFYEKELWGLFLLLNLCNCGHNL